MSVLAYTIAAGIVTVVLVGTVSLTMRWVRKSLENATSPETIAALVAEAAQPIAETNQAEMNRIGEVLIPMIAQFRDIEERRVQELQDWRASLATQLQTVRADLTTRLEGAVNRLVHLEEAMADLQLGSNLELASLHVDRAGTDIAQIAGDPGEPPQADEISEKRSDAPKHNPLSSEPAVVVADVKGAIAGERLAQLEAQVSATAARLDDLGGEVVDVHTWIAVAKEDFESQSEFARQLTVRLDEIFSRLSIASDTAAERISVLSARIDELYLGPERRGSEPKAVHKPGSGTDTAESPHPATAPRPNFDDEGEHGGPGQSGFSSRVDMHTMVETALSSPEGMISIMIMPAQSDDAEETSAHKKAS